jgi:ABC-2 type transport system permease protein
VIFLIVLGLFVWVFPDTSVLNYGFSTLDSLFNIAPWVFMFLIPAITMRSFSEENKTGTIELLTTRPITDIQIILGKYFAGLVLVFFAILPTLIYYFSVAHFFYPCNCRTTGKGCKILMDLVLAHYRLS